MTARPTLQPTELFMSRRILRRLGLVAAMLVAASSLMAQNPRQVPGFSLLGGMAVGTSRSNCDACTDGQRGMGPVGVIGLGWARSTRFQLVAEISGWFASEDGVADRFGYAELGARVYPLRVPLYLGAGAGYARHRSRVSREDGRDELLQTGPAASLTGGVDLAVGREVTLSPFATWHYAFDADITANGSPTGFTSSYSTLAVGVALVWRWSQPPFASP